MEIKTDWNEVLTEQFKQPYFKSLIKYVKERYEHETVYPPYSEMFNAFNQTPFSETKVVIVGQDPYHGEGQANGLSFSVHKDQALPPSLKNIFKELESDYGCYPEHGDLTHWANQGVLLLNTSLTVKEGEANAHHSLRWDEFTKSVIQIVSKEKNHVVFVLWGKQAYKNKAIIDERHTIVHAPHPSPLSAYRGFFGSKPFSQVNEALNEHGQEPVNWCY
ncbi:uracil-DNA glycosylase [Alkalibacillus haloalkaliphilus]|uniref:uracil-DNA glycosylase n=1 Tax=Alkalibacillus haloalkaliphilus TaxID=94136 RepID=UPI0002DD3721|nr:uracil-DNA glycosylase [Alkalibacillus haloalkaliphilus]